MSFLNQFIIKANQILKSGGNGGGKLTSVENNLLISLFNKIGCKDLKIDKPLTLNKPNSNGKKVYYYPLIENDKFTLAIFAFPPYSSIPIHDHPQMTVFSKVLYGSIHCDSFDWVDESSKLNKIGKVKYFGKEILDSKSENVKITLPNEENIHRFQTGNEHSAVLDVLFPPYDHRYYRNCTYYKPNSIDNENSGIIDLEPYYPDFDCESDPSNIELLNLYKELQKL